MTAQQRGGGVGWGGDCVPALITEGLIRTFNQINVKFPYLSPLIPTALKQLWVAKTFTKLNLLSAYNIVHIKAGLYICTESTQ